MPERLSVQLVFAESGAFHTLVVHIPVRVFERYDRLIDALREEPAVTGEVYVDPRRLVAAYVDRGENEG